MMMRSTRRRASLDGERIVRKGDARRGGKRIPPSIVNEVDAISDDISYINDAGYAVRSIISVTEHSFVFEAVEAEGGSLHHPDKRLAIKTMRGPRRRKELGMLLHLSANSVQGITEPLRYSVSPIRAAVVMRMESSDLYAVFSKFRMDREYCYDLFLKACIVLKDCHALGYVHRDIKLENLLLSNEGTVVIADWGFGTTWSPFRMRNKGCGSSLYAAPEILLGKDYKGPELDVFSLGVVLHGMLTGFNLYRKCGKDDPHDGTGRRLNRKALDRLEAFDIDMISWMTEEVSIKRPTLYQIVARIQGIGRPVKERREDDSRSPSCARERREVRNLSV